MVVDGSVTETDHGYVHNDYGDFREGVSGEYKLSVNKSKTETIVGDSTEDVSGSKIVNAKSADETVTGSKSVSVGSDYTETATGKKTVNAGSSEIAISGNSSVSVEGDSTETYGNKNVTVNGDRQLTVNNATNRVTVNGNNETYVKYTNNITGDRLHINTDSPLQYSEPYYLNKKYNAIKMTSNSGNDYEVLVKGENIDYGDLVINVKDFGAIGDGISDDTNSIQNALNSVGTDGKSVVWFPRGTYICNGALVNSDTVIVGYGASLKTVTANNIMRNNSDGTSGGYSANSNIRIIGLDFSSNNTYNCTLLTFGHCFDVSIIDCSFHDISGWHMIEINGCRNVVIDRCTFYNYGYADATNCTEMLQLDSMIDSSVFPWFGPYDSTTCTYITIQNCYFDLQNSRTTDINQRKPSAIGNHSYTDRSARYVKIVNNHSLGRTFFSGVSIADSIISGNTCGELDNGVYINGGVQNITISDNTFLSHYRQETDRGKRGIYITGSTYSNMYGIVITNNAIKNFAGHGIVPSGRFITVANNTVQGNNVHGIYGGYDTIGLVITGNVLFDNLGTDIYANYHSFDTNNTDVLITSNRCSSLECVSNSAMPVIIGNNQVTSSFNPNGAVSYNNYHGRTSW